MLKNDSKIAQKFQKNEKNAGFRISFVEWTLLRLRELSILTHG